ncbi:MAG: hypothetical protein EOP84_27715 [Verrucomicrobiaceae bacterium]|nr:MAG: hypothetical protein EOP84_27715 [Verrucomicrobiaceae bacterium]
MSQPDVIVFDRVIKTITTALALDSWSWFVDHAVRELVHRDFFGARGKLNACLLSTIWPEKPVELVDATKDVIESFSNYITYYETNAEQRESFFGPNKAYKRFWNRRFDEFATFEEDWSNHCYWLLCKFVLDLNRFADMVRKHVEPMFFRERGYFLVEDTMGFRSGLTPTLYRPTADAVELGLRKYPPPTPPAPLERDSAEAVISVRDMWLPPLLVDDTENKKAGTRRTVRSAAADAPKSEPRSSTGSKSKLSRAEGSSKKTTKSTSTKAGARRTVRPVATNAPTSEPRNRAGSKSKLSRAGGSSKKTTKSTSTKTRANSASTKATKSKSTRKRGS